MVSLIVLILMVIFFWKYGVTWETVAIGVPLFILAIVCALVADMAGSMLVGIRK